MKTLLTSLVAIAACCLLAAPVSAQDTACDVACGDEVGCCDDACGASCCDCSGIEIGAEVLFLDVFAKEGAGGAGADNMADFDYEAAFRVWGGYEFANGLGVRFRWFSFDHGGEFRTVGGRVDDVVGLDIDMYDIELTDDLNIGCWELTPSIGVRWGEIEINDFDDDLDRACGVGAVVGLESRRYLCNCWSIYANGRYGVLYGNAIEPGETRYWSETDTFFETIELQVGLEWSRCTASGANLFARVGWEQQMYLVDEMFDVDDNGKTGDISLAGPMFAIGLSR